MIRIKKISLILILFSCSHLQEIKKTDRYCGTLNKIDRPASDEKLQTINRVIATLDDTEKAKRFRVEIDPKLAQEDKEQIQEKFKNFSEIQPNACLWGMLARPSHLLIIAIE